MKHKKWGRGISMYYFGVDYYPEHWPKERWGIDAQLMKEMGMNTARIGEFAWVKMEPEEGKYNFAWLDEAIQTLASYGMKVILGTPTAAPPAWLIQKYPSILPTDEKGHRYSFGSRRHYCFNNKTYHRYTDKIVTALAERYGQNENVIGWQVDNEFGCHNAARCYCENCAFAFRDWLKNKYETLEELNKVWGTEFWSQRYTSWEQVDLPKYTLTFKNPTQVLDYYRFASDSVVNYQKRQVEIIRKYSSNQFITHNMMFCFSDVNYKDLAKDLNLVSLDNYQHYLERMPFSSQINHDIMRSLKGKAFLVMEQQAGQVNWQTINAVLPESIVRPWTYQAIERGANGILYFRFRAVPFGAEQYHSGILDHSGDPKQRKHFSILKRIGQELELLDKNYGLFHSKVKGEVAIFFSYENLWNHQINHLNNKYDYFTELTELYRALHSRSFSVDYIFDPAAMGGYKVMIIPGLIMLENKRLAEKLGNSINDGGKAIIIAPCGLKDQNNHIPTGKLPLWLSELIGCRIKRYGPNTRNEKVKIKFLSNGAECTGANWIEELELEDAEVIAEYRSGVLAGNPAVVSRFLGKGICYYSASPGDKALYLEILRRLDLSSEVEKLISQKTETVELQFRYGERKGEKFLFAVNHEEEPGEIHLNRSAHEILSGEEYKGPVQINGHDVMILTFS